MDQILTILASLLVLIGLLGTLIPTLPGLPLIWLGFLLEAFASNFTDPMITTALIVIALTTGLFYLLQVITAPMATKHFGGTNWGAIGALIGLLIAISISFTLVSFFVLPLCGAFIGELANGQTRKQAFKSGIGAVVGILLGTALEFALGLSFTAWFIFSLASE